MYMLEMLVMNVNYYDVCMNSVEQYELVISCHWCDIVKFTG